MPGTKIATVYHADTDAVRARGGSAFDCEANWPEEYNVVARVETGDLGTVFEKTNHIDHEWWDNDGVERIGPPTRSTSVGDVVVLDGVAHRCEPCGWSVIGPFEVAA